MLLCFQIAHLAQVSDHAIARVLSWHMSADMDCVVTITTRKVRTPFLTRNYGFTCVSDRNLACVYLIYDKVQCEGTRLLDGPSPEMLVMITFDKYGQFWFHDE